MRILHIMSGANTGYEKAFIEYINNSKLLNEGISHNYLYNDNNFLKRTILLLQYLVNTDRIILHGLFSTKDIILFNLIPGLAKKSRWMIWGGDLYNYYLKNEHSRRQKLAQWFKVRLMARLDAIGSLPRGDYEFAREITGKDIPFYQAFYKLPVDFIHLRQQVEIDQGSNQRTILLGNSSSQTNNHREIIDVLKIIDDGSFKMICPLSYGDEQYGDSISDYGKKNFGDRFTPLREFYGPEEYAKILSSVDVAIFNHDRQQALGNIIALLFLKKKVYVKKEVSTYSLFTSMGVKLFDTGSIVGEGDTQSLFSFDDKIGNKNSQLVGEFFSDENFDLLWHRFITG